MSAVTARCDLSDLPVEMCGCRVHAPAAMVEPSGVDRVGTAFPARYPGRCPDCDRWWRTDDRIQRGVVDGEPVGYVHEECP